MRLFLSNVCLHTNWNEMNQVHCVRAEKAVLISIFCTLSRCGWHSMVDRLGNFAQSLTSRSSHVTKCHFLSPSRLIAKERATNHRVNIAATPKTNVLIINLNANVLFHVLLVIRLSVNVADCLDMTKKLTFALLQKKVTKKKDRTHKKVRPISSATVGNNSDSRCSASCDRSRRENRVEIPLPSCVIDIEKAAKSREEGKSREDLLDEMEIN